MSPKTRSRARQEAKEKEEGPQHYEFIFLNKPLRDKDAALEEGLYMYIAVPADQCWQYGLKPRGFVSNVLTMFGDITRKDFNDNDIALIKQLLELHGDSVRTSNTTKICKPGRGRILETLPCPEEE